MRNIAHYDIGDLPSKSQLAIMQREAGSLSRLQVGEVLLNEKHATMHTDGTSKAGHHYSGLQISNSSHSYSVGINEIVSGTADNYFKAVQSTLSECERVMEKKEGSVKDLSKKMMVNIKNLMSDKHVVETKFTQLFTEARGDCLPDVIEHWSELQENERVSMMNINKFHCGLHALANMATSCEESLKCVEKEDGIEPFGMKFRGESNIYAFIKAVCNLFFKDGGGCPGDVQIYLKSHGFHHIPVQPFSGSRFNVLFHNGGGVFSCLDTVKRYLAETISTKNRLHTTILSQIADNHILSGCRALGLINKLLTGPLWRALVREDVNILDMSSVYSQSLGSLERWAKDSEEVLYGRATPFQNATIEKDIVYATLTTAHQTDESTKRILQVMFSELIPKWEKWFAEHLPGGLYSNPTSELTEEAAHVPTTNIVSERDFAQLDRARTIAPHANTEYFEGKILYRNNKTSEWIENKSEKDQSELISLVRKDSSSRIGKESESKKQLIRNKIEVQKEKTLLHERQEMRKRLQKEKILIELQKDGGLWLSGDDAKQKLMKIPVRQRKNVLKTQIRARKQLLGQGEINPSLFSFSANKKQLNTEELMTNLLNIIQNTGPESTTSEIHLVAEQINKIKFNPTFLIDKNVSHCYVDDGEETWWEGRVVRQKRRSVMFVVKYVGEKDEYELSLDDIIHDISIGDLILHVYVNYYDDMLLFQHIIDIILK